MVVNYEIVKNYCTQTFGNILKYSTGWFARFMKRSKRVITGTCRDVTAHSAAMKNMKIEDFRQKINALPKHITLVNMDETPVYFNSIPNRTVTSKGEKHVKARVAGDEKKRVPVVLGCCSNGEKLPPMVITKQSLRGVTVPQGMLLRRQPKAWMTSDLMLALEVCYAT